MSSPHGAGRTNPNQSAFSQWCWGFHTVQSYIDPRDHRFRPRCFGVAVTWKDFRSGDGTLSSLGGAGSMNPSQSAISQSGVKVSTPCGAVSNRGTNVSSPVCWTCRCIEGFLIRGWDPILPVWRWLHEPQPISNQPVGVDVSTPCGTVSTRGTTVFVPGVFEVQMYGKGFLIRGWDTLSSLGSAGS